MKITKRQLRRIIREASRDLEGYGQIHYPEGYMPTNTDRVYEIIQPLLDTSNIGLDRQGEIAMEIADMYATELSLPEEAGSAFLKDEIYARAEEQIIADQEGAEEGGVWSDERDFEAGFMS